MKIPPLIKKVALGLSLIFLGSALLVILKHSNMQLGFIEGQQINTSRHADMDGLFSSNIVFISLKNNFPTEFQQIEKEAHNPAEASAAVGDFIKKHIQNAAVSSDGGLQHLAKQIASTLRAFEKTDISLCASIGLYGTIPSIHSTSEDAQTEVEFLNAATITAIKKGIDKPIKRDALSEEDVSQWLHGLMSVGLTKAQIEEIFSGSLNKLPTEQQCTMSIKMYEALSNIPPQASAKIMSNILLSNQKRRP